jgi:hypothetical protein
MKMLRTLVIVWGFVVVLILPVMVILSHTGTQNFFEFRDYVISVLLFLLGVYIVKDSEVKRAA